MKVIKKFEIGTKYYAKSICDQECVWTFEVVKRTKCFIWIKEEGKSEVLRRKVYEWDGAEACSPLGKHSMSPTLNAERFVEQQQIFSSIATLAHVELGINNVDRISKGVVM
jgi:hypothetical protein